MAIRVLVVDDSGFFRRRISEMLQSDPRIKVIDTAVNGEDAVAKTAALKPDVITMDIEMPVMDGITAVRKIMASCPTPVLMFSSLTTDGAKATLEALEAGAVDFLPKRFEDISKDHDEAKRHLCDRVHAIGIKPKSAVTVPYKPSAPAPRDNPVRGQQVVHREMPAKTSTEVKLVAIGTSTGGPLALQTILSPLPGDFPVPIVLIQHMPAAFTPAFAHRLNQLCAITVKEGQEGDVLNPGTAYLAPGGKQMILKKNGAHTVLHVMDGNADQTYKPSIDITFSSIADVMHGDVLAVVLTGMGADGREGARRLKQNGATIWAQDEATSVVYGMPAAVAEAGLADNVLALSEISGQLVQKV